MRRRPGTVSPYDTVSKILDTDLDDVRIIVSIYVQWHTHLDRAAKSHENGFEC